MGHTPLFDTANALLSAQLGYHLQPSRSDAFRNRLAQLGLRRFRLALAQTVADSPQDVQEAHCLLEANMWQLVAQKGVTRVLRNPQAHVARATMVAMDERVMELVEAAG